MKIHAVARKKDRATYFCHCGFIFGVFSYDELQKFEEPDKCPKCGDALDWNEANEWALSRHTEEITENAKAN